MLLGKVKQALGFINSNSDVKGVHTPSDEIIQILKDKHPKAEPATPEVLLPSTSPPQPVIFECIDADLVLKSTMHLSFYAVNPLQERIIIWQKKLQILLSPYAQRLFIHPASKSSLQAV